MSNGITGPSCTSYLKYQYANITIQQYSAIQQFSPFQGRLLVLDLASDQVPQYARLSSYFGQPWVFCMLHNYGGVQGLYGNAQVMLQVGVQASTAMHRSCYR